MKEYDREKRAYVNPATTEKVGDLKKKHLCRGNKVHEYVLVLPEHLKPKNPDAPLDLVTLYYDSEDRLARFSANEEKIKRVAGLVVSRWDRIPTRHYECAVCGKKAIDVYAK